MDYKKPYNDISQDSYFIRVFDENIDPIELKWHRDLNDRNIKVLGETDWMIQFENQLPIKISENFIPKGTWHRLIKGNNKLKVKIYEI